MLMLNFPTHIQTLALMHLRASTECDILPFSCFYSECQASKLKTAIVLFLYRRMMTKMIFLYATQGDDDDIHGNERQTLYVCLVCETKTVWVAKERERRLFHYVVPWLNGCVRSSYEPWKKVSLIKQTRIIIKWERKTTTMRKLISSCVEEEKSIKLSNTWLSWWLSAARSKFLSLLLHQTDKKMKVFFSADAFNFRRYGYYRRWCLLPILTSIFKIEKFYCLHQFSESFVLSCCRSDQTGIQSLLFLKKSWWNNEDVWELRERSLSERSIKSFFLNLIDFLFKILKTHFKECKQQKRKLLQFN